VVRGEGLKQEEGEAGPADVVIVGGGPAGSAAGIRLRQHAPALKVVLIEAAAGYEDWRLGETLPPLARPILEELGVWEAFEAQGHAKAHGTLAAWGSPIAQEQDFLLSPHSHGWHLDRAAFDSMLAAEAEKQGVRRIAARAIEAKRESGTWRLELAQGGKQRARFLVDATGSAATFARRLGARFVAADRLTAYVQVYEDPPGSDPRSLVEAFENGWWYTAGLPKELRVVACMTDSDLGQNLGLGESESWSQKLEKTSLVKERLQGAEKQGKLLVRAASSRRLEPATGVAWLATGDAATVFDPLSASGITKALRGGIFAAYAISDLLEKKDQRSLERYRHFLHQEEQGYFRVRARYYAEENRWPDSEFWRRRKVVAEGCETPSSGS